MSETLHAENQHTPRAAIETILIGIDTGEQPGCCKSAAPDEIAGLRGEKWSA